MKTGAAYNIFQGTELLPYAIEQVRDELDLIVGCIQSHSWTKNEISKKDLDLAFDLQKKGLIDELIFFTPAHNVTPKAEQTKKSEFCKLYLQKRKCDYFIVMDVDEIYFKNQFKAAKEKFIKSGHMGSACKMETYYKTPEACITPKVDFYVPFMYKMDMRKYLLRAYFPVHVDQSRKLPTHDEQFLEFHEDELMMHHYSYVRTHLSEKTNNSANRHKYEKVFDNLVDYWEKWELGQKAMIGVNKMYDVRLVDNYFNIDI